MATRSWAAPSWPESPIRMVLLAVAVLAVAVAGAVVGPAPSAQAANLFQCKPPGLGGTGICTTITSAPPGGVRVKDRGNWTPGATHLLYNGYSVKLDAWSEDTSRLCGNQIKWVWRVQWHTGSGRHTAYIGDYYLATGDKSYWQNVYDPANGGLLGDAWHYSGKGRGNCDIYPNG